MTETGPFIEVTRYSISWLPPDFPDRRHWTVYVEWRGTGWAVFDGFNCYDRNGEHQHEPSSSNRDDTFLQRFRFQDRHEAVKVAGKVADSLRINRVTWRDAQKQRRQWDEEDSAVRSHD